MKKKVKAKAKLIVANMFKESKNILYLKKKYLKTYASLSKIRDRLIEIKSMRQSFFELLMRAFL